MNKTTHAFCAVIVAFLLLCIKILNPSVVNLGDAERTQDQVEKSILQKSVVCSEVDSDGCQKSIKQEANFEYIRSMQANLDAAVIFRNKKLAGIEIKNYIQFIKNLPEDIDRFGFVQDAIRISFESTDADRLQLIPLVENELSIYPNDPTLLASLASIYFDDGNYAESIKIMEKIIYFQPDSPDILYQMGLAYGNMGDDQNSKMFFSKAVQKSSDYNWLVEMGSVAKSHSRS